MKSALAIVSFAVSMAAAWAAQLPNFQLTDVNPGSQRHNAQVSPRDYLMQVSGYYFGAAG